MSPLQHLKAIVGHTTHLAKDALHVHVALIVFFGAAALFRWPLKSPKLWLLVLAVACAGEAWDITDSLMGGVAHNYAGSLKDVVNTMAWPTAISALARWTRLFSRR